MKHKHQILLLWFIGSFFFLSCSEPFFDTSEVCTLILKSEFIEVVDQQGEPVTGANFTVVNKRNDREFCRDKEGNVVEYCANDLGENTSIANGIYAVVTSHNVGDTPYENVRHLDVIRATVEKNGASVTADYIVDTGRGKCHPEGIEGPGTLVLDLPEG